MSKVEVEIQCKTTITKTDKAKRESKRDIQQQLGSDLMGFLIIFKDNKGKSILLFVKEPVAVF